MLKAGNSIHLKFYALFQISLCMTFQRSLLIYQTRLVISTVSQFFSMTYSPMSQWRYLCRSCFRHELLPFVPLFWIFVVRRPESGLLVVCIQSLLEMGTRHMYFVQLNQLIGTKTGGISVYHLGSVDPCAWLIVKGKAMAGRVEDLFNLEEIELGDGLPDIRSTRQCLDALNKACFEVI